MTPLTWIVLCIAVPAFLIVVVAVTAAIVRHWDNDELR